MNGPGRVTLEQGNLVLSIDGQIAPLDLSHWHYDTFRAASRDKRLSKTWVSFRIGTDVSVTSFAVDGIEQDFVRRPAAVAAISCDPSDADRTRLANRASPYDSTEIHVGGKAARLCYSRPSMRGRTIFGSALVPYDSLWRTGPTIPRSSTSRSMRRSRASR